MKHHKNSGRLVAQLRKLIDRSQSQFAAMVGVSKHTIISVENGRNKLSRNLASRIQLATGANILDEHFEFEAAGYVSATEEPRQLTPEAVGYLRRRYDGTGRYDHQYTRDDFEQWRKNFYPSNDRTARKQFEQIKFWLEVVFRAAAKSAVAGNRDRLPAVRQSLVEWLNETLENFKLQREVDEILETETHFIGEAAYSIASLTEPKHPKDLARIKDEFAAYGYDFAELKKHFKKAKPHDWIVLPTECRRVWDPLEGFQSVPCETRTLLPKPEFRIEDGWDVLARMHKTSKEELLQNQAKLIAELQAKQVDSE